MVSAVGPSVAAGRGLAEEDEVGVQENQPSEAAKAAAASQANPR